MFINISETIIIKMAIITKKRNVYKTKSIKKFRSKTRKNKSINKKKMRGGGDMYQVPREMREEIIVDYNFNPNKLSSEYQKIGPDNKEGYTEIPKPGIYQSLVQYPTLYKNPMSSSPNFGANTQGYSHLHSIKTKNHNFVRKGTSPLIKKKNKWFI